jgi:hypothetical protein
MILIENQWLKRNPIFNVLQDNRQIALLHYASL